MQSWETSYCPRFGSDIQNCFKLVDVQTSSLYRAAWNADAVSRWEFCLSVCLSNACIVTKRKKDMFTCLYHTKIIYPGFLRRRMVGGGDPFYPEFRVNRLLLERNRWFWTDNQPQYSAKNSSINTNRKSHTRCPTSLRWSSYVATKSPKGWLKNAKRPLFL